RTVDGILKRGDQLAAFPLLGRVVDRYKRPGIRELVEAPYRILYRVRRETIEIIDVFTRHSCRHGNVEARSWHLGWAPGNRSPSRHVDGPSETLRQGGNYPSRRRAPTHSCRGQNGPFLFIEPDFKISGVNPMDCVSLRTEVYWHNEPGHRPPSYCFGRERRTCNPGNSCDGSCGRRAVAHRCAPGRNS